eukprot:NODE_4302_length_831_cov_47.205882_g3974_i0.p1 GENE.NODE_4302_length_831_cov_47.205882_g3974_i0~~NODE_4302_length_831_cov_47.205882_g3974_i0.p1  ORF type:complete len:167 (-),score=24.00 NODE_4302_length_831_cov_47.205882_g3974_i0:114-614(-)
MVNLAIYERDDEDVRAALKKTFLHKPHMHKISRSTYIPPKSHKAQKRAKKAKLSQWGGMRAGRMNARTHQDLVLVQNRDLLAEENRAYKWKKPDKRPLPKYFELGTIKDDTFGSSRSKRGKRIADEWMASAVAKDLVETQHRRKAIKKRRVAPGGKRKTGGSWRSR